METFSTLLAICAGNSPVSGEFPAQRPVTRSFDVFFDLRLNKRLSKQSWGWWFEMPSCPLWRHCNASIWLAEWLLTLELLQPGWHAGGHPLWASGVKKSLKYKGVSPCHLCNYHTGDNKDRQTDSLQHPKWWKPGWKKKKNKTWLIRAKSTILLVLGSNPS